MTLMRDFDVEKLGAEFIFSEENYSVGGLATQLLLVLQDSNGEVAFNIKKECDLASLECIFNACLAYSTQIQGYRPQIFYSNDLNTLQKQSKAAFEYSLRSSFPNT